MIYEPLPLAPSIVPDSIRKIGVIFKTHLDLGFTDYASEVYRKYMEEYMPRAVSMALHNQSKEIPFRWTTGSWLVSKYLAFSKGKARREFETALADRLICWHALPFTFQSEALTPPLLLASLKMSRELDRKFGFETIAAKMTDVPGHCRGIIPILADQGIRFLHIGVNPASPVPDVPHLFRWQHPDGAEILVCYDGSYGGFCQVPGKSNLFAVAMTGDNAGPPTQEKIKSLYGQLRMQFPRASVDAASLEDLASQICRVKNKLPVVTSEIGDTWIHGYGSDPGKMAAYRELSRLREQWIQDGKLDPDSLAGRKFDENLLLVAEHTWGLDEKTWMHNGAPLSKIQDCYTRPEFQRARRTLKFQRMEQSWKEQRAYIDAALHALPSSTLRKAAKAGLHAIQTPVKAGKVGRRVDRSTFCLSGKSLRAAFAPDAAVLISGLAKGILGRLRYQTFGGSDYARFLDQYLNDSERYGIWAPYDFGKTGLEKVVPEGKEWPLEIKEMRVVDHGRSALIRGGFPLESTKNFGAPALVEITVSLADEQSLQWEVRWWKKAASRIPEALWFSFHPRVDKTARWKLLKMGGPVDPRDVVSKGSRSLHIVQDGVEVGDRQLVWKIQSPDAGLVAPGKPSLLNFHDKLPDCSKDGIHFNLLNNVWGTNFPMWYGDDGFFRFSVQIEPVN